MGIGQNPDENHGDPHGAGYEFASGYHPSIDSGHCPLLAISGKKNTGKTTLGTALTKQLAARGLKVGVIKHDGHDFSGDIPGTDSFRYHQSGASVTAVFSPHRFLMHKQQPDTSLDELLSYMQGMDIVLVEGMKSANLSRIEVLRKGISEVPTCDEQTLIARVTDFELLCDNIPTIQWDNPDELTELVCNWLANYNSPNERDIV